MLLFWFTDTFLSVCQRAQQVEVGTKQKQKQKNKKKQKTKTKNKNKKQKQKTKNKNKKQKTKTKQRAQHSRCRWGQNSAAWTLSWNSKTSPSRSVPLSHCHKKKKFFPGILKEQRHICTNLKLNAHFKCKLLYENIKIYVSTSY